MVKKKKLKVVLTGGVFDILHLGHIFFLKKCKEIGDKLVVVIACDKRVIKEKKRKPVYSEKIRAEVVQALKPVDEVIIGDEKDILKVVEKIKPDIIALGYDQKIDEKELERELKERGISLDIIRIKERLDERSFKTSKLLKYKNINK